MSWFENDSGDGSTWTKKDIATLRSYSVHAADIDGDGDMDIVAASYNSDTIAWYENNNGDGSSWTATNIATDKDGAKSVFAADMDGDGDMDIVSASINDDTIAWYENDGAADPSWTTSVIATSAETPESVFAEDMDGDGDMDIVSASRADNTIAWYENNGAADPSWAATDISTSAGGANSVHAADMDGDGDMDIVSSEPGHNNISWYENNGATDPSWTKTVISYFPSSAPQAVFAADMDGDGDMDVLSALNSANSIAWYENNVGYSFTRDVDNGNNSSF